MPKHDAVRAGEDIGRQFVEGLWKDFRYARAQPCGRARSSCSFVVLTLALGIGANTTVFTLINTLILNPLPVRNRR